MLRRLASHACCAAAWSCLPDILLPYGQVGVGVKGGLEAAIHSVSTFIENNGHKEDLCYFKIDMRNAFNECHRHVFFEAIRTRTVRLSGLGWMVLLLSWRALA